MSEDRTRLVTPW